MNSNFKNKYETILHKVSFTELSTSENEQLLSYLWIFKSKNYSEHWQVNQYISENKKWDCFDKIRALNDHGYSDRIKGILPKYFAIVCSALEIGSGSGNPLLDSVAY